ncbi:acyl carrier protein [Streptomyces sp. NPDC017520]|uniref:acyl carrier protein n=1 Tax=Streptomyces sp. NPDC017520 TaxID=3364998 RepID=UPI0037BB95F8
MTSETETDAAAAIRAYVRQHMSTLSEADLHDDDNIFEKGFVTSVFAMQLLDHLETTFGVEIPDDCITLQNFSSVNRMAAMVGTLADGIDG